MQTLVGRSAPSSTLLKFLHAQHDGIAFFSRTTSHYTSAARISKRPFRIAQSRVLHTESNGCGGSRPTGASQALTPRLAISNASTQPYSEARSKQSSLSVGRVLSRWFSNNASDKDRGGYSAVRGHGGVWSWARKRPVAAATEADLQSFLDDGASLGRVKGPAHELKLRCTEFDENGNKIMANGEFKKSELIAKYGLLPRDLRKIDSSLLPNILVRPSAILINLLHLRVLIKHDRVLVFDAYGSTDSYTQSMFLYDLELKLKSPEQRTAGSSQAGGALPYEFRALESVLISVTTGLEGEFEGVRDPVVRVLRDLEEDIDRDKLRYLLIYSKKLSSFEQRARLVREAIDDILEADDDLADMYLSEKMKGKPRTDEDHTEVEMLLESYYKVCDEIVQISGNLLSNIRNTEEIIRAILDSNRNSLMLLELKFNICTLGLSGGTFIAALYGMNLENFIEETSWGFGAVSGWCAVISVIVCMWGFRRLRRVQKLSMWGLDRSDRGKGRSGWSGVSERPMDPAMAIGRMERMRGLEEGHVMGASEAWQKWNEKPSREYPKDKAQ